MIRKEKPAKASSQLIASAPWPTSRSAALARLAVALEQLLEVGQRLRPGALEHPVDHLGDRRERDPAAEEGRDRDLVRGVQRARCGPPRLAGLAREPQAGECLEVGGLELEPAGLGEVETRHGDVGALGEVQGEGDRHPHVGQPQVRELGAVVELDQRVDDRLRMDDDGDPLIVDPEQVVRLDHLEPLVHQGRRVDRDPPAHLPGRVGERLLDRHPVEVGAAAERPAGGGQHQPVDRRRALGAQQLEDRRVLGVDRQDPGAGRLGERRDQLAADHQALLVGERQLDPLGERDDRRAEAGGADDRVEDEIGLRGDDQIAHALVPREHPDAVELGAGAVGGLGIADRDHRDSGVARLRGEPLPVAARREAGELERLRAGDHVERLFADRPGGAEDQDSFGHRGSVATVLRPG